MKKRLQLLLICFLFFGLVQQASAQGEMTISLSRDFGYGGNGEIQGTFSIHVRTVPEGVQKVEFYIDETLIGEDTQAPFAIQFSTDSYPAGMRSIYAVGYVSESQKLTSNKIDVAFVAADAVGGKVFGMVGPLLGVVFGVVVLGFIIPMVLERKKGKIPLGAQRNYGLMGGTICPKCGRPFALHTINSSSLDNASRRSRPIPPLRLS